jgi:hypothetical protein
MQGATDESTPVGSAARLLLLLIPAGLVYSADLISGDYQRPLTLIPEQWPFSFSQSFTYTAEASRI